MGTVEMKRIAAWIDRIMMSNGEEAVLVKTRGEVQELCRQFPIPNGQR
jgi:glycine/serine hydroxymethyltransferase